MKKTIKITQKIKERLYNHHLENLWKERQGDKDFWLEIYISGQKPLTTDETAVYEINNILMDYEDVDFDYDKNLSILIIYDYDKIPMELDMKIASLLL